MKGFKRTFGYFALGLLVTGCRQPQSAIEIYYSDPQAMFLVPVTREIPKEPESVLRALSQPPAGLSPILPKEATASVTLQGKTATATLGLPTVGGGTEQLMAAGVVKSLGSLGTEEVRLTLKDPQGRDYPSEHMDTSAPMHPGDPEMENLWQAVPGEPSATVYWATPDGGYLVPVRIPLSANQPIEGAFRALLDGPHRLECFFLANSVPMTLHPSFEGVRDGVAEIKVEHPKALGAKWETAQRAMLLTLTEFRSVSGVRFLSPELPDTPMSRPAWINKS